MKRTTSPKGQGGPVGSKDPTSDIIKEVYETNFGTAYEVYKEAVNN